MRVIDSRTAGEPTRVILDSGPSLGAGSLATRAARLEAEHGDFRTSVMCEPRGQEAMVGALLVPAGDPTCATGVIYFNATGNLGMCGHATIGLGVTLAHLGRIGIERHRIETPVGVVAIELTDSNTVSVTNVESYRLHKDIEVDIESHGTILGDVAWGGNWFYLVKHSPVPVAPANLRTLADLGSAIRDALAASGITGANGAPIDHVELFGPSGSGAARSRNYVLCPDGAYDRSPCGTGSSAKLACLAADGDLEPGEEWVQESIIGSTYRLFYQPGRGGGVIPTMVGRAFVTAESTLIFNPADPYVGGIRL